MQFTPAWGRLHTKLKVGTIFGDAIHPRMGTATRKPFALPELVEDAIHPRMGTATKTKSEIWRRKLSMQFTPAWGRLQS